MKQYKVVRQSFVEEKDSKLKQISVSTFSTLGENLAWKDAVALRKANKGAFITQQHSVVPEPV